MAAATAPIYTRTADIQWATAITAANTAKDGTGTVVTVFTADATEGGYVQNLVIQPAGTNVATVMRVFLNNGSTNTTASNNAYIGQLTLSATTNSEVAAIQQYTFPLNFALPAGYKINIVLGTAVAAGYVVSCIGGKY